MERSWGGLGWSWEAFWGGLGDVLGFSWGVLGCVLGGGLASWVCLGASWGRLGRFGLSRAVLGAHGFWEPLSGTVWGRKFWGWY